MVLKRKSMDSRLKISGMTEGADSLNASIIPLSLIPEWFYCPLFVTPATSEPGSTVFKTKEKAKTWIPD